MNWVSIVNAALSINALAAGVWLKEPQRPPAWASFALVKTAIFHPKGTLKVVGETRCPKEGPAWHAWIVHRVAEHDVFTESGGLKLGIELGKALECHKAVEFDLEPLPAFRQDHVAFFRGVRKTLPQTIELRLAVPPIAGSDALTGLFWTRADVEAALAVVDGLDFMVYDTGARTPEAYERVLEATLSLARAFPTKKIIVGLPAYVHGIKGRHRPKVENLSVASQVWRCGLDFAVYAGWTMTEEESRQAAGLVKKCNP